MKRVSTTAVALAVLFCLLCMLTGCAAETAENTVHSADDLIGKTICVQIGTTGMAYAEGIENATVDKYIKARTQFSLLNRERLTRCLSMRLRRNTLWKTIPIL